jgi:hypothetical protein
VFFSLRARRWRRVLAEHGWRAVRYRYTEYVLINISTGDEGRGNQSLTRVMGQLTFLDPSDGTSRRWVSFDRVWAPLAGWRLRPWRQAREGVAWLAGDLSGDVVVALPGPGRLFGGRGGTRKSGLKPGDMAFEK